jgi:hypothetical protein
MTRARRTSLVLFGIVSAGIGVYCGLNRQPGASVVFAVLALLWFVRAALPGKRPT